MRISDWSSDVCSSDLQHAVRVQVADVEHEGTGLLVGREVAALAAGQIHGVEVEVLVAAVVAQVQQGVGPVRPEVVADAARLVVGDRTRAGDVVGRCDPDVEHGSEEHTSELQSLMRISYAVFCLNKHKIVNAKTK